MFALVIDCRSSSCLLRSPMLVDIEHARANKTPAKNIPYSVFKAMIADEGIPVDDRNKLIRDRGDKRFKELR